MPRKMARANRVSAAPLPPHKIRPGVFPRAACDLLTPDLDMPSSDALQASITASAAEACLLPRCCSPSPVPQGLPGPRPTNEPVATPHPGLRGAGFQHAGQEIEHEDVAEGVGQRHVRLQTLRGSGRNGRAAPDLQSVCTHKGLGVVVGVGLGLKGAAGRGPGRYPYPIPSPCTTPSPLPGRHPIPSPMPRTRWIRTMGGPGQHKVEGCPGPNLGMAREPLWRV